MFIQKIKKKTTRIMLRAGFVTVILFLGFFGYIVWGVVSHESIVRADQEILKTVTDARTPELTGFFKVVTLAGNWQSIVFLALVVALILFRKKQIFRMILLCGGLIATEITVTVLKHVIGRTRPDPALRLVAERDFSFPSGHATISTVIFGILIYMIIKSFKKTYAKIVALLAGIGCIALIAFSRIYLGVHYPSDIMGSIALGCGLLTILIIIAEIHKKRQNSQKNR